MKIIEVPIEKIANWKDNPKSIKEEDLKRLKYQIKKLGVYKPLLVTRALKKDKAGTAKYISLGGNQRLKAFGELKTQIIPCSLVKADTQKKRIEYSLSDNDQMGRYESDLLNDLVLPEMDNLDLDMFKLDLGELTGLEEFMGIDSTETGTEDDIPEVPEDPVTKTGDLYQLGDHRLLCGDATKKEDVDRLMGGEKADMVFTDPPYGMDLDTDYSKMPSTKKEGNKTYKPVIGDDCEFNPQLILDYFSYCQEIILFGADYYARTLPNGSWYVWDKRVEEKFDRMFGSSFELIWSKHRHKREIARFNNTLFSGETEARNKVHPTQKPTKLVEWFFERISAGIVVDIYGGSGSTLISCEKTGRSCRMMEIDPHYCDVIVKRWEEYTQKKATLIS